MSQSIFLGNDQLPQRTEKSFRHLGWAGWPDHHSITFVFRTSGPCSLLTRR